MNRGSIVFEPYALAPNFCASKKLLKKLSVGVGAQMDKAISMICGLVYQENPLLQFMSPPSYAFIEFLLH